MAKNASLATVFVVLSFAAHVNAQQSTVTVSPAPVKEPFQPAPPPKEPAPKPDPTPAAKADPTPAPTPTPAADAPTPPPAVAIKPAEKSPPVKKHITTPIIVAGGISVVGLATGTLFGVLAASDHSKYTTTPNNDTALSGEKKAFVADVSFGIAALFGLTAIALYMLPDEPDPNTAPAAKTTTRTWLTAALKGEVLSF